MASEWFLDKILWWDQVTVTPDKSKTILLSKGTPKGLKGLIPIGGQTLPISKAAATLA